MTRPSVAEELTVVVPTLGRPHLERCLRSIASAEVWPAEVIVVDQGRRPEVAQWVAGLRTAGLDAAYVPSEGRGVAAGTNLGLSRVTTRYVAVTHDDCEVSRTWVKEMSRALARGGDAVVTGRVEPCGEGEIPSIVTSRVPTTHTRPGWRDVLYPANMGTSVDVLRRVGRFDESPLLRWAAEDNDWAYRALRLGIPIVYDPSVVAWHLAWRDEVELDRTYGRYARSQGALYGKWIRRGDLFMAARALRSLANGLVVTLLGFLRRDLDRARRGLRSVRGVASGLLAGLRDDDRQ